MTSFDKAKAIVSAFAKRGDGPAEDHARWLVYQIQTAIETAIDEASKDCAEIADRMPHRKGYTIADEIREKYSLKRPAHRPIDSWRGISPCGETPITDPVRIYSGEHGAYWRKDGHGYSSDIRDAWVLSRKEAERRTSHCGPEKLIQLEPVSVSPMLEELRQAIELRQGINMPIPITAEFAEQLLSLIPPESATGENIHPNTRILATLKKTVEALELAAEYMRPATTGAVVERWTRCMAVLPQALNEGREVIDTVTEVLDPNSANVGHVAE